MKVQLKNNQIVLKDIVLDPKIYIPEKAALTAVKISHPLKADGTKDESIIESVKYEIVDTVTLAPLTLKVVGPTKPIITQEELEQLQTVPLVSIPNSECNLKIYKTEFGKAFVTITCPSIKLIKNG